MEKKDILMRKIREKLRGNFDIKNIERLQNEHFTIICSNCTAGVIYHSLHLEFLSPTINMYLNANDFIKLCSNLREYFSLPLSLDDPYKHPQINYPVVKCGDILLWGVHYKGIEEFERKWRQRIDRIQWDNIFLMMTERDFCTYEDIVRFEELDYKKVIFTHKVFPEIKSSIYIPGTYSSDNGIHHTKSLTDYRSKFSGFRYIDTFDYVHFLNTGERRLMDSYVRKPLRLDS